MDDKGQKLGTLPYVIGGVSFIPLVGLPFGLIAIVWGLLTKKSGGKTLAVVGSLGIAVTLVLYGSLFYFGFVQRGGIYDDLRQKLAQSELNSLVQAVEFYKIQNGQYPASLAQLQQSLPKDSFVSVYDPSDLRSGQTPSYFYYALDNGDHYYLRGTGPDHQPFTADDIVPQTAAGSASKLGLLTSTPAQLPK